MISCQPGDDLKFNISSGSSDGLLPTNLKPHFKIKAHNELMSKMLSDSSSVVLLCLRYELLSLYEP